MRSTSTETEPFSSLPSFKISSATFSFSDVKLPIFFRPNVSTHNFCIEEESVEPTAACCRPKISKGREAVFAYRKEVCCWCWCWCCWWKEVWVFVSEKIQVAFLGTLWIFLRFGLIKLMVLERSMVYGIVLYCYIHSTYNRTCKQTMYEV
jgi:hypothetical protein